MTSRLPVIAGVGIAIPLASGMGLTWLGSVLLSAGLTALFMLFGGHQRTSPKLE